MPVHTVVSLPYPITLGEKNHIHIIKKSIGGAKRCAITVSITENIDPRA